MKNKLLTSAVAACVVGSIASMCFYCLPQGPQVDLEVLPDAFQKVGPIRQATESSVDYTVCNRASAPIWLLDVAMSCTCSGAEFSKRELAPGESATLTLNFDTEGRRGSLVIRGVLAYIIKGEEKSHALRLGVEAEIDPDYAVEPERLAFGDGRPPVQRITISPRHISDLKIDKVACNLRFFQARVLPKDDSSKQDIEVTFLEDGYYPDAGFGKLTVSTDSERQPMLIVPLDVTVENALSPGGPEQQAGIKP